MALICGVYTEQCLNRVHLLDLAGDRPFDGYIDPIDGRSLAPALHGSSDGMRDIAISEFAADGSTGPSRMVKRGTMKYMDIEGVDELLFDLRL